MTRPLLLLLAATAPALVARDLPIPHDVHRPCPLPDAAANDVRGIAVSPSGRVWAATAAGVFTWAPAETRWSAVAAPRPLAPAFAVRCGPDETVWVGAWNGLFHGRADGLAAVASVNEPIGAVGISPEGDAFAAGPDGFHHVHAGQARRIQIGSNRQVRHVTPAPDGAWWLATGMGCFVWREDASTPDPGRYLRGDFRTVSVATRGVAFDATGQAWIAALGGLQVVDPRTGRFERLVGTDQGLPSADVRCVARAPDGRMWAGTAVGVVRQEGSRWSVRQGRRWLLNDDVRDLAFDRTGAAWIATAGGVSRLGSESITLATKADRFHAVLEARHVRPPGIVEKCRFRTPGDLSTWGPTDDDNDGGYTALALAMESFRYAATRQPEALAAARRAFGACEFLQRVTETPGFLARTVIPADWTEMHDPNLVVDLPGQAEERVRDARDKYVPVRWRPSADRRWLWKGDTSSDEMTAHFFGYFMFHELAADAADRRRVRDQVCRLADHLLEHGLVLQDQDGRPTRWAIWAPERLNDDPDWEMERGINSVEILSFLKVAHHVAGDPKYDAAYRRLIHDHHYDRNTLAAPNLNPAWRTYIDFELLAFAYPALLALEHDPALARTYRRSFERWHDTIRADGNPFFEALYARYGSRRKANLLGARAFLADTPLDLIRWDVRLAQREDVHLRRHPEAERWQTQRLLPASEIGYSRTDQNPWAAEHGEGGLTESDGVFWLLPYWMGRLDGWLPTP